MNNLNRFFLITMWMVFSYQVVNSQQVLKSIKLDKPVCEFPLIKNAKPVSIPYTFKRGIKTRAGSISVSYYQNGDVVNGNSCSNWPSNVQAAFDHAAAIWEDVLQINQDIVIGACWSTDLAGNTLGSAGPTFIYSLSGPGLDNTLFPSALAEQLVNQQLQAIDINATFNANRTDWYFGTDANPPSNEIDFASVVLHELGHGLGFLGLANIDDGDNSNGIECNNIAGHGCIGGQSGSTFIPTMYDRYVIETTSGNDLISNSNPSTTIGDFLQGNNGGISFNKDNDCFFYGGTDANNLYAPSTFQRGSSYSHFDEGLYPNELMSPFIGSGQAIHDVGLAADLFYNIGWSPTFTRDVVSNTQDNGLGSLRYHMQAVCPGDTVFIDPNVTNTITLQTGEIIVDHEVILSGNGAALNVLSGGNTSRIFNVGSNGNVTIHNISLTEGFSNSDGGSILVNDGGILHLHDVILENNNEGSLPKSLTLKSGSTLQVRGDVIIKP